MSTLEKGTRNNRFRTYADGYVLGSTNKEPPYAAVVLSTDITFGGFDPSYRVGTEGMFAILQDGTGGHEIDWDGKLTFIGSSGISLAADTLTVIDLFKSDIGWVGFVRSPGTSIVQSINGLTGTVTLEADDVPFANVGGKYAITTDTVDEALLEIVNRMLVVETRGYIAASSTPFAVLQAHRNKTIRQTYSSGDSTLILSRPNFDIPNLPAGSEFFIANFGTGKMTISPAGDVTVNGAPLTLPSGKFALLKFLSDNGTTMSFDLFNYSSTFSGWQVKTSAYTASDGDRLFCDTSAGVFNLTLPATPSDNTRVDIADAKGTFDTYPLTVLRNGTTIHQLAENMIVDTKNATFALTYSSALATWRIV